MQRNGPRRHERDIRDGDYTRVISLLPCAQCLGDSFFPRPMTTATTGELRASGIAEITNRRRLGDFHRSRKKRDDSFPPGTTARGRSNVIFINSGATLLHCNTFSRDYPRLVLSTEPIRFVIPLHTGRRRFEQVEEYFASDCSDSFVKRLDNARFRSAWRNYLAK